MKTNRLIEGFKELPEEGKKIFLPILEKLPPIFTVHNEGVKRKYEFSVQFTTIVGVVFGVLASFNSMGHNLWADIFYVIGMISCGVSLCLCLICLYKPIYDNEQRKTHMINEVRSELDSITGISTQKEQQDKSLLFEKVRMWAYITFGISIVCILIKIIILFIESVI